MNTTLSTPRRQDHPPIVRPHPVRRVGLLDRIALHVGIALIKWGRRPINEEKRERRATRVELHYSEIELDRMAERRTRLSQPF